MPAVACIGLQGVCWLCVLCAWVRDCVCDVTRVCVCVRVLKGLCLLGLTQTPSRPRLPWRGFPLLRGQGRGTCREAWQVHGEWSCHGIVPPLV